MIAGLRVGGAFGDDVEGLAPAWVIGVAAILPAVVVVALGWSAAAAVEADVERAFDRRLGVPTAVSKRRSRSLSLTAGGGPNHKALRQHGYINQLPGTHVLGVAITAVLAGLSLLSLIGAVVVFLFWQETQDGVLLPAQSDRAWDVVSLLHTFERNVALGLLALAMIWSFLAITNIRLASMRRRNPIFAAVAWTIAAVGVSITGAGLVADGSVGEVILGFAIQAFFLAIPVFLLYRGCRPRSGRDANCFGSCGRSVWCCWFRCRVSATCGLLMHPWSQPRLLGSPDTWQSAPCCSSSQCSPPPVPCVH